MISDEFPRVEGDAQVKRSSKWDFVNCRKCALALVHVVRGEVDDAAHDHYVLIVVRENRVELDICAVLDEQPFIVDRANVEKELIGGLGAVQVEEFDVAIRGRRLSSNNQLDGHLHRLVATDADVVRMQREGRDVRGCTGIEP